MNVLVIGGTKFFGIPMVEKLLADGHRVTIASRGNTGPVFGDRVSYIKVDRTDKDDVERALSGRKYDVVIDKVAYSSNDVKYLLDNVSCGRYIMMSTCSVYADIHEGIKEEEFDPTTAPFEWAGKLENYRKTKQAAECAAAQVYNRQPFTFIRYPVVVGENDPTGRLYFYCDHIVNGKPMKLVNSGNATSFIDEKAAGEFMAHLVDHPLDGPVTGSMSGKMSPDEMIRYIEEKTGKKAVISGDGDRAPFSYSADRSFDTSKAESSGFSFGETAATIKRIIDFYLDGMK